MRFIQEKTLKKITKIYKITLIEILQVEINIASIDIYLSKLTQKSITNIKSHIIDVIIAKTMRHICDNLILRKKRKSKLRKTFLQLK